MTPKSNREINGGTYANQTSTKKIRCAKNSKPNENKRNSWDETEYKWSKNRAHLLKGSGWLLRGRSNTNKRTIPTIRTEKKKKRREQGKKAHESHTQGVESRQFFPVSATKPSRNLATRSAIFFLLSSSTAVSSLSTAAVEHPPPWTNRQKPTKLSY